MFRPAKIFHITAFLRKDAINKVITPLHEAGVCSLKQSDVNLGSEYSYEDVREVEETYSRLKFLQDTLNKYKEVPQPEKFIKSLFNKNKNKKQVTEVEKKYKISLRLTKRIVEAVKKMLDKLEPNVKDYLNQLSDKKKKIDQNKFLISNLYMLPDLKTGVFKSTENIKSYLGIIQKNSFKKIEKQIEDIAVLGIREVEKDQLLLTVFTFNTNSAQVENVLHEIGFEVLTIPFENKKPIEIIKGLKKENDILTSDIRDIKKTLKALQKENEEKNKVLIEELEIAKERADALKDIKSSNSFSVLEAWVPKSNMQDFHKIMKDKVKDYYAEIKEKDDAPTKYKNPSLIRPFEMLVNLYSPPKYKDFDPTPLVAVFFTIFFGFMLDDFFYGLILVLIPMFVLKKAGKNNQTVRNVCVFLIILGVSTMFWGIVFGAYFGNFFQEIGIKLPMLIDAMKEVMLALGIAIGLGALHLLVGLIAGFYDNLSKLQIRAAFANQGVWLFFMIGSGLAIMNLTDIGLALIGLAVLMQVGFTLLASGVVSAILSIFAFTGFIGDLFSYARLMALSIGTSGISLAVNFMALLAYNMIPYVGIVFAILIFIVGHAFNMAMNGLGAFIHSTRLHFLEFFTKFFEGGGIEYKPFKAKRKHTILEGG